MRSRYKGEYHFEFAAARSWFKASKRSRSFSSVNLTGQP